VLGRFASSTKTIQIGRIFTIGSCERYLEGKVPMAGLVPWASTSIYGGGARCGYPVLTPVGVERGFCHTI